MSHMNSFTNAPKVLVQLDFACCEWRRVRQRNKPNIHVLSSVERNSRAKAMFNAATMVSLAQYQHGSESILASSGISHSGSYNMPEPVSARMVSFCFELIRTFQRKYTGDSA